MGGVQTVLCKFGHTGLDGFDSLTSTITIFKLSVMRIYVSLPITGHEETAPGTAKRVQEELRLTFPEAEVITPFDIVPVGSGLDYAECMGKDITELLKSDAICTVKVIDEDWIKSRGAMLELAVAMVYDIDMYIAQAHSECIDIYRAKFEDGYFFASKKINRHGKD